MRKRERRQESADRIQGGKALSLRNARVANEGKDLVGQDDAQFTGLRYRVHAWLQPVDEALDMKHGHLAVDVDGEGIVD